MNLEFSVEKMSILQNQSIAELTLGQSTEHSLPHHLNAQLTPDHSMPAFQDMQPKIAENMLSSKRTGAPGVNTTSNLNKELSNALRINVKTQSQRRRNIVVNSKKAVMVNQQTS